jgi:Lon protease-like protein
LHVFEPRYRVMTQQVMGADREFGVVLIERGSEVGGGDVRFAVGTVARIVRAQELPDGGYALAAVGVRRIRVIRWLPDDPFPRAEVVDLEEPPDVAAAPALRDQALSSLGEVCELYRRADPRVPALPAIDEDAARASYEIAALAPIGPLDAQRVLATERAGDRLRLLCDLLDDHARVLQAGDFLE